MTFKGVTVSKPVVTDLSVVKGKLEIILSNHGVKGEKEFPKAELYLDCRGVANPSHGGPSGSGDNPVVQDWVAAHSDVTPFWSMLEDNFERLTVRKGAGNEFEKPFRVCTLCAHGVHRSRAMKFILARMLASQGYLKVEVK